MNDSVALFINLEKLASLDPANPPKVSLGTLIETAQQQGHLAIRRAFGDVNGGHKDNPGLAADIKSAIAGQLLQVEHIPVSSRQATLVSVRLVIEALSAAYTLKSLNCFVFVGIDPTVAPLLGKLRELGHRVVVFADGETCDSSSVRLISNECFSFSSLAPAPPTPAEVTPTAPAPATPAPATPSAPARPASRETAPVPLPATVPPSITVPPPPDPDAVAKEDACRCFCEALHQVLCRGRKPVVSAVSFELTRLYPALNLAKLGLNDADHLAAEAEKRGFVRLSPFGSATLVNPLHPPSRPTTPPASPAQSPDLATCRGIIRDRLKCNLPSLSVRKRIYQQTVATLPTLRTGDANLPVTILELSTAVAARFTPAMDQFTVFKILFTLLISNVFLTEQNDPRPHTILIKKIIAPVERWDELLIQVCTGMIKRQTHGLPPDAGTLASLFETPRETITRLMD